MRAVDTNVLVRLLTRDDMRQTALAESFVAKGAWVSVLALAEAVWVLDSVYEVRSIDQAKAIEMLLSHRQLTLQDRETIASALALFRTKPSLGFSDCLMLEMARKAGNLPLGTFDRNLGKIEGAQKL
jgi:predicted nucleic-acid-binding protein